MQLERHPEYREMRRDGGGGPKLKDGKNIPRNNILTDTPADSSIARRISFLFSLMALFVWRHAKDERRMSGG
jgi:hypothetical protein